MTIEEIKTRLKSRILWGNCLGMLVVSIILVILLLVFLSFYTHHGENIAVPDLRGMSQEHAEAQLRGLGLELEVSDSGYVRTLPPDAILSQQVAPGTEVKQGRVIRVTINNANSPTIALPDLADNCSLHEAKARLTAIGFRLAPIEYTAGEHDWVYAIKVHGRTMTTGQRIPVNQAVTIVVGDGSMTDDFNGDEDLEEAFFGTPMDSLDYD